MYDMDKTHLVFPPGAVVHQLDIGCLNPETFEHAVFPHLEMYEHHPLVEVPFTAVTGRGHELFPGFWATHLARTGPQCTADYEMAEIAMPHLDRILGRCTRDPRRDYVRHRDWVMTRYLFTAYRKDAPLSSPAKCVTNWLLAHADDWDGFVPHDRICDQLSVYGNRLVRRSKQYDILLLVRNQHSLLHTLVAMQADAFRFGVGVRGMHVNLLLIGEAMTSKSFLLGLLQNILCIPLTVFAIGRQTKCANQSDNNQNDITELYHEFPIELIMQASSSDNTLSAIMKSKLSESQVGVKLLDLVKSMMSNGAGEGTFREARYALSDHSGNILGASNITFADADVACLTRFAVMDVPGGQKGRHSISELAMQNAIHGMIERPAVRALMQEARFEQAMQMLNNKFIMTGAFPEPSLHVAHVVLDTVTTYLAKAGVGNAHPRVGQRFLALTSTQIIAQAIEWLYFAPGAPYYDAERKRPRPFEPMQLRVIDELLYSTLDVSIFAITMLRGEFFHIDETRVLRALCKLHQQPNQGRYSTLDVATPTTTQQDPANAGNTLRADYNYMEFNGSMKDVATLVHGIIKAEGSPHGYPIMERVADVLHTLARRTIEAHPIEYSAGVAHINVAAPKQHFECAKIVPRSNLHAVPSFQILTAIVLAAAVSDPNVDHFRKAIESLSHQFALPQRFLMAEPLRGATGNLVHSLFEPVEIKTVLGQRIHIQGEIFSDLEKTIAGLKPLPNSAPRARKILLNTDLDSWGLLKRRELLCLPIHQTESVSIDEINYWHPAMVNLRAGEDPGEPARYPDDLIAAIATTDQMTEVEDLLGIANSMGIQSARAARTGYRRRPAAPTVSEDADGDAVADMLNSL
jgi:hypothetical protein